MALFRVRSPGQIVMLGRATETDVARGITPSIVDDENTLLGIPGDHEFTVEWAPVPGATSYSVEVTNPLRPIGSQTQTVATGITGTGYTHSPYYYAFNNAQSAQGSGAGLLLGLGYRVRVIPNVGSPLGPVTVRPDDGFADPHGSFPLLNGSAGRRDARNVGHVPFISADPEVVTGTPTLDPGTYTDTIFTGTPRVVGGQTYTFERCWVYALQNANSEPNIAALNFYRSTFGLPIGLGANAGAYDQNGLIGSNGGKHTFQESLALHGGSQIFSHIAPPTLVEDSFFAFMYAPDFIDLPHMDCIWMQGGSPAVTVRRTHFEAASRGMSAIIGPGNSSNGLFEDILFNGGSASGTVKRASTHTFRRGVFKYWRREGTANVGTGTSDFRLGSGNNLSDSQLGGGTWQNMIWEDGVAA